MFSPKELLLDEIGDGTFVISYLLLVICHWELVERKRWEMLLPNPHHGFPNGK